MWKATFLEAYVARRRAKAAREGEEETFGGYVVFGASAEKKMNEHLRRQENTTSTGPARLKNKMMESLEGHLDNIAAADKQTVAKGGPLVELAGSLEISVDTVTWHQKEIKRLSEHDKCFEKERYAGRQRRYITQRRTGGDDCIHTL